MKAQSPRMEGELVLFSFSFSQELLWPRLRAEWIPGQTAGKWDVNMSLGLLELRLTRTLITPGDPEIPSPTHFTPASLTSRRRTMSSPGFLLSAGRGNWVINASWVWSVLVRSV